MRRIGLRTLGDYVSNGMSRVTVQNIDDSKLLQELGMSLFPGEQQETIEHAHPYGYTAVPQKPTQQSGTTSGSSGAGGSMAQAAMRAAEAFVGFMNGCRSHGVALLTVDRRFRLQNLQPGEVANHDDQTQQRHIARDGIYDSVPYGKKITHRIMKEGDSVQGQASGGQAGAGSSSSNQSYGQQPWKDKEPYASWEIDENGAVLTHPKKIVLQVGTTVFTITPGVVSVANAQVQVAEDIIAGYGGADQISVQDHLHSEAGGAGDSGPPVPGT